MKKIKYLLLLIPFLFISSVKANEAVSDLATNGQIGQWQIPLAAQCFNSSYNSVNTSWNNNYIDAGGIDGKDFYSCNFGSNGLVSITTNQLLADPVLYSLVLYVGNSSSNEPNYPTKVGVGDSTYTARNDIVYSLNKATMWSSRVSNKLQLQQPGESYVGTISYYAVYVIFSVKSNATSVAINITYPQSQSSNTWIFGYELNYIGRTDGLKKSDVESALSSSGFATASSVNEVKKSVNEVKQEISGMKEEQKKTNEELKKTNDTLNDDTIDDSNTTDTLDDLSSKLPTNSVISDLLLLPVRLFQNVLNSINGSCNTFNLGSLYGSNLTLPCIDIESIIGSTLWSIIDILFCGAFVLVIRKKFVDIFHNLTDLRNGGNDLE